jgi:hypothetical protein
MARYGCTITVQAGEMPSTQTNFTWVAVTANFPTAAIDGGSQSILNGGGNFRAYTDSGKGTRLPVEVVEFVTGGSPSIVVWGLSASLGVGGTVYIEGDTVATAQPAPSAAFGSEDVWTGYPLVAHLNEAANTTTGGYKNSSGGADGTGVSMSLAGQDLPYGVASSRFAGTPDEIIFDITTLQKETTFDFWAKVDSTGSDQRALSAGITPDTGGSTRTFLIWADAGATNDGWASFVRNAAGDNLAPNLGETNNDVSTSVFQKISVYASNTRLEIFVDGVSTAIGTYSDSTALDITNYITIGRAFLNTGSSNYFSGGIGGVRAYSGDGRAKLVSEFNVESNPAAFWSTSAWEDQDSGTGITANGAVTLPSLVFNGSATDSTSEVTANGDVTLPSLVFSGSATDSTSEVTANGDVTLPSLVFSGSATDSTSEVTANGDVTLPSLVFSGSATDSTSEVTANGAVTLPSLVFSGSAAATQPAAAINASGDITLPSLVFSGSATDSTSQVTANGDVTLPSLVFSGTAGEAPEVIPDFSIIIDASIKTIQTTANTFTIRI